MDLDILKKELTRDEGFRLRIYTDTVGKVTVGVGHNLTDKGISQAVCDLMLDEDIAEVTTGLDAKLPWWAGLDPVRQRVLANMGFNLGITKLLTFANTLKLVQGGFYDSAADMMLNSLWAHQVGARATRLADMMRSGKEPAP